MISHIRPVTTERLFRHQEKIWERSRPLPMIQRISNGPRCLPQIKAIASDILRLKVLIKPSDAEKLRRRMTPQFKARLILMIDDLRHRMKEAQQPHFGNPKLYQKARKDLKDLRAKVISCKVPKPEEGEIPDMDAMPPDDFIDEIGEIEDEIQQALDRANGPRRRQHRLDELYYGNIKKDRKTRKILIVSVAVTTAGAGVVIAVAGATALGVGTSGVGFAAVPAIAIPMLIAGELMVPVGTTIVLGGASSSIIRWLGLEPSIKRFTRKYYSRQLGPADFKFNGRPRQLDYDTRWKMIQAWSEDFKVPIGPDEIAWYSCIHNFPRWLKCRYVIDTHENRKALAKLMTIERKNLLWAEESGPPPLSNEVFIEDPDYMPDEEQEGKVIEI